MHILAFDTCLGAVSVAVARLHPGGGELLHEACEPRRSGHAERLMPMLIEATNNVGIGFADIERIAVTVGPGSFTGVRTGVAAARALALATGRPAVGVGCLAAIAFAAQHELGAELRERGLAVALDARLGLVYFQRFNAAAAALSAPCLLTPQACAKELASSPVIVVGSAAVPVMRAGSALGAAIETRLPDAEPRAAAVALLAARLAPDHPLQPLYLRAPDAKAQADGALPRALP
jgi:tRNA threonylcarbamoyladenosine biosynthesis protein TsaB